MCGESRKHGVEWGKSRRLFQRFTYHYQEEDGVYHINLKRKYADILKPKDMVYHFNNCVVPQDMKEQMLKTSLENLDEMRAIFSNVRIIV